MSGPPLGYRRYLQSASGVVGLSVPGPEPWKMWYASAGTPEDEYLPQAAEMDDQFDELRRGTKQRAALLLVPLANWCVLANWAATMKLDPADPVTRAQWGAEQIGKAQVSDEGTPIIRGFLPYQRKGDGLAIAIALAAGWDGRRMLEPPAELSDIKSAFEGRTQMDLIAPLAGRIVHVRAIFTVGPDGMPVGSRSDGDWVAVYGMLLQIHRTKSGWVRVQAGTRRVERGDKMELVDPVTVLSDSAGFLVRCASDPMSVSGTIRGHHAPGID